jgi:hypothetical protein
MARQDSYTSGAAFIEFWDYMVREQRMNQNSARALGSASKQVLSVEEDWEKIDISTLDEEALIEKFIEERGDAYSHRTQAAYALRFQRALRLYLAYLKDPEGWMPPNSPERAILEEKQRREHASGARHAFFPRTTVTQTGVRMISYPFPLRESCVAQLRLPVDLTAEDVERLSSYLQTLVIDPK